MILCGLFLPTTPLPPGLRTTFPTSEASRNRSRAMAGGAVRWSPRAAEGSFPECPARARLRGAACCVKPAEVRVETTHRLGPWPGWYPGLKSTFVGTRSRTMPAAGQARGKVSMGPARGKAGPRPPGGVVDPVPRRPQTASNPASFRSLFLRPSSGLRRAQSSNPTDARSATGSTRTRRKTVCSPTLGRRPTPR